MLGLWGQKGDAVTYQQILDAGQLIVQDTAGNRAIVNDNYYAGTADPRRSTGIDNWYAVPVDATFLADLATNSQCKGLVFVNRVSTELTNNTSNVSLRTKEDSSGPYEAYLEVTFAPVITDDEGGDGAVSIYIQPDLGR